MSEQDNFTPDGTESSQKDEKSGALAELQAMGQREQEVKKKIKIITIAVVVVLLITCFFTKDIMLREMFVKTQLDDGIQSLRYGWRKMGHGIGTIETPKGDADGFFSEAMMHFNNALERDKKYAPTYYLIGNAYYGEYFYQKAMGTYPQETMRDTLTKMASNLQQALRCDTGYTEVHYYMAIYYYETQQYDKSIEELTKGLNGASRWSSEPQKKEKWVNFGEALKKELIGQTYADLKEPLLPDEVTGVSEKKEDF